MAELKPTRWWRVIYADGRIYPEVNLHGQAHYLAGLPQIWCETSDEDEARAALATCPSGGILQHLYQSEAHEWRNA